MELTIERLSKRYGQHFALRELSLRCEPGLLGLVGPNGAGKTSLMRMIATLLEPTEGTHPLERAGHSHPWPGAAAGLGLSAPGFWHLSRVHRTPVPALPGRDERAALPRWSTSASMRCSRLSIWSRRPIASCPPIPAA